MSEHESRNPSTSRQKAPLILVEGGYSRSWDIYEPGYNFDGAVEFTDQKDRRYEKVCHVEGTLKEALNRLAQLERGR